MRQRPLVTHCRCRRRAAAALADSCSRRRRCGGGGGGHGGGGGGGGRGGDGGRGGGGGGGGDLRQHLRRRCSSDACGHGSRATNSRCRRFAAAYIPASCLRSCATSDRRLCAVAAAASAAADAKSRPTRLSGPFCFQLNHYRERHGFCKGRCVDF